MCNEKSASLPAADGTGALVVKSLEWRTFCPRSGNCLAGTPFGEYVIQSETDGWCLYLPNEEDAHTAYPTLEFAEAAAQADFKERIRSCLASPPAPLPKDTTRFKSLSAVDDEPDAQADGTGEVAALLDEYWDLAFAEGREGREHDTPTGDAQRVRSALSAALASPEGWRIDRMLEIIAEAFGLVEALSQGDAQEEVLRHQRNLISVLSYEDWTIPHDFSEVKRDLAARPTGDTPAPLQEGAEKLLAELEAKAGAQKAYFDQKQRQFPSIEDFMDEDGTLSLPEDIAPLLQGREANGRYSEADWWLSTIQHLRSALAARPTGGCQ